MKNTLIAIVFMLTLAGCSKEEEPLSSIFIRVANASKYDFDKTIINTTTGKVNFGKLNSGKKTEYRDFEVAYEYAYVELHMSGSTFVMAPRDYVGSEPLENGIYTYKIKVNACHRDYAEVNLELVKD